MDQSELSSVPSESSNDVYKAQPINFYTPLIKQIEETLVAQMDIYVKELKALDEAKDPEHALAMIVFEEDGLKKVEKRGRKVTTKVIGPIPVSFELPHFCFEEYIDFERVLETPLRKKVCATPVDARRFSVFERTKNWTMELRKRINRPQRDVFSIHLPTNHTFRSRVEVTNYILYEALPTKPPRSNIGSKRNQETLDIESNELDSTSNKSNKRTKTCSDVPQPQVMEKENKIIECSSKEIGKNEVMDSLALDNCEENVEIDDVSKDI